MYLGHQNLYCCELECTLTIGNVNVFVYAPHPGRRGVPNLSMRYKHVHGATNTYTNILSSCKTMSLKSIFQMYKGQKSHLPRAGIEPTTPCLQVRCSTNWATRAYSSAFGSFLYITVNSLCYKHPPQVEIRPRIS